MQSIGESNMRFWDNIDNISQLALEDVAKLVGVEIKEWGNLDSVKTITELLVKEIAERFKVLFPYIDENF